MLIEPRVDYLGHCEEAVEEDVEELGKIADPREGVLDIGEEHDEGDDDVLPAVEDEEVGEPVVEPAPVVEHQPIQEFKFPEAEVTDRCSRVALFANDSDPDVGLFDHAHIVASVPNRQNYCLHVLLDKPHYLSFLLGGAPAEDHRPRLQQNLSVNLYEVLALLLDHVCDLPPLHNHGHLVVLLELYEQFFAFRLEVVDAGLQLDHFEVLLDEPGQVPDVLSRFHLVACDHHDDDARPLQPLNGLGDLLLQPILDSRSPHYRQVTLDFLHD